MSDRPSLLSVATGATRRRLLKKLKIKGKRHTKVRWRVAGEKKDESFYYVGTLDDLKREIARAGEIWTNPTMDEVIGLIMAEQAGEPDPG